ncbi:hypothetical protein [uncultured Brevundimonas sp.]|uniref:hypothetical protein n=1 Tax=uncultured Brevundimonas sp. TaxID=213418 RepID=UPI0030EE02EC|tara:strand:- start:8339 stop:8779 length:441 start_codon:yes stop_codon:yes gene_type:complete
MIKALSLAAALAFATPALAGMVPQAAPAAAAKSAEEVAFEARAEVFKARMAQMNTEFEAAVDGAGGDQTRGMAAVNAVLARYQPDIAAFLTDFDQFIDSQAAGAPDDAARQGMGAAKTAVRQSLEAMPDQMRAGARTAIARQVAGN